MLKPPSSLSEIMRQPVASTPVGTTVAAALAFAKERNTHHLPITAADALVGVVCTCDLYKAELEAQLQEVMKPPITIEVDRTSVDAANVMRREAVGSVIVVDGQRVCGIVTRGDLLERAPESERALGQSRCECCGLSRHLRTDAYGQTLCIHCRERASDDSWFDMGAWG